MSNLASRQIDYALLPMDGVYTMTPEEAAQAAAVIKAKNYIPIHTLTSVDEMAARFNVANKIVLQPGSSYELKSVTTGLNNKPTEPGSFYLEQNYPNPFNPETTIGFSVQKSGSYLLSVFNLLGEEAAKLIDCELGAGYHKVNFNARGLSGGMYLYVLKGNGVSVCRKMLVLK